MSLFQIIRLVDHIQSRRAMDDFQMDKLVDLDHIQIIQDYIFRFYRNLDLHTVWDKSSNLN